MDRLDGGVEVMCEGVGVEVIMRVGWVGWMCRCGQAK